MSDELKPCPFCGKTTSLRVGSSFEYDYDGDTIGQDEMFAVYCDADSDRKLDGCGASAGYQRTEIKAIKAWNTRITTLDEFQMTYQRKVDE